MRIAVDDFSIIRRDLGLAIRPQTCGGDL